MTDTAVELLTKYGYIVLFLWTFVEGETCVIIAGILAQRGLLKPEYVIAVSWLGATLGDQLWFQLGAIYGKRWLAKRPHWAARVSKVASLLERNATLFILCFRFIYGVRNAAPFAVGVSGVSTVKFATLNFIAAGIWASLFTYGGYFLGHAVEGIFEHLRYGALVLLAVVVLVGWLVYRRRRKREKP